MCTFLSKRFGKPVNNFWLTMMEKDDYGEAGRVTYTQLELWVTFTGYEHGDWLSEDQAIEVLHSFFGTSVPEGW